MVTFVRLESTRSPGAGACLAASRSPAYRRNNSSALVQNREKREVRIYLRFDDCEIFLSLDQVEDERVDSGKNEGKEESESMEVEVALCVNSSGGN